MKPKILFLTNKGNGAAEEDELLIDSLKDDLDISTSHPLECEQYLDAVDGVIIRNIWPTHEYEEGWQKIKTRLRESGLTIYNPLTTRGDVEGKDYLVELYKKGFPMIPSVNSVDNLDELPAGERYFIKPKHSCDGIGAKKLTREELLALRPRGYVIQPFVEFVSEPSFFFIDNKFHHAISMKNRLTEEDFALYKPSQNDLVFAQKFIDWAAMPYGLNRIDAVRLADGSLLLTEVENQAAYLYINEIQKPQKSHFLDSIRQSILKVFNKQKDRR